MVEQYAARTNTTYESLIITRPDLYFSQPLPNIVHDCLSPRACASHAALPRKSLSAVASAGRTTGGAVLEMVRRR
jgi:hypothetical protein